MKQVLARSDGALVARMPTPAVGPRDVLVRNRYSLISTGTETAAMQPAGAPAEPSPATSDALYFLNEIDAPPLETWTVDGDSKLVQEGPRPTVETAPGEYAYGLMSPEIHLAGGTRHVLAARIRVLDGNVSCGLLSADGQTWLAIQSFPYAMPEMHFSLYIDVPRGRGQDVKFVVNNHRPGKNEASTFQVTEVTHLSWARAKEATAEPVDAPTPTPQERLKTTVKKAVRRWTGEENSRQEQALKRWYGRLTGNPIAARTTLVSASGLPQDDMSQQGWNLGYSSAGEVVATGERVTEFAVGDLVACGGAALANHAEYVSVPVNLVAKLPPGVDCRAGCSATVGAIALQGVRRAELELSDRVVVLGLGLIGQLTVQLARAAGCRVMGFDPLPARVAAAKRRGMHDGASDEDAMAACVRRWTGEHGADAVIITAATKSAAPVNQAMNLCRRRGRVVISGDVDIHPERAAFYRKEIDLRMATSYGPGRYDASYEQDGRDYPYAYARWTTNRNLQSYLEMLADGSVDFLGLVEAEASIDDAPEAYRALVSADVKPMAVLLSYPPSGTDDDAPDAIPTRLAMRGGVPLRTGPVNFVLVGAGAFGQAMLVPKLLACPDAFQFYGVVSRHGVQGANFARSIGVPNIATELDGFLADPEVGALIIATRHHEHLPQTLAGLRAGKHVFVEKPLAISRGQLDEFLDVYGPMPEKPHVMVGFNRRFSPAILRLREIVAGRRGPLMISYRVNAGRIPADHWIQGEHGGGRNIGEACHMYDVFRALTGAAVERASAMPLAGRGPDLLANDNFTATIRYEDGSVATLLYTAIGPKQGLPKERIEIFCDGSAYIVDDFCQLTEAGRPAPLWAGEVDKGHAEEIRRFGACVAKGADAPIPIDEIIETTALALTIEEQLR